MKDGTWKDGETMLGHRLKMATEDCWLVVTGKIRHAIHGKITIFNRNMGKSTISMAIDFQWLTPFRNWFIIPINYRKSLCLMGKSTISTGPFSSSQTVNVYQRVYIKSLIGALEPWNGLWLSIQLGMSSSQLTFIFFRGVETTNQIGVSKNDAGTPQIGNFKTRTYDKPVDFDMFVFVRFIFRQTQIAELGNRAHEPPEVWWDYPWFLVIFHSSNPFEAASGDLSLPPCLR